MSRMSLRRLLAVLLGALGLLVAALIVVAALQVRGTHRETQAENRRTTSFLVADSLRQSSNDLTNMVRLYVQTRNPAYRDYYNEILAIRAGSAPRPRDYDSSFWDRVLAEGKGFVRYGPKQSLTAQMRAAHFAADEFKALQSALDTSQSLAKVENTIMSSRRPDSASLYDQYYLHQKGEIMAAIVRFTDLVQARTNADLERARSHNRRLVGFEIAILVLIVLVGVAAVLTLTRVVVRPLDALIAATRRIGSGDYSGRVEVRAVTELERVAGAFNAMGEAVQADVTKREEAEQEAVAAQELAEHASRAKTTFLAAMSHEIRTPMIGVTGMLEVLARTELTPQQRQMVQTAENSAASLLQIIGDILDFSKIEAEKLELAPAPLDVRAVVGTAVETFVHTASAKGLLVTFNAQDAVARAHVGDPLRIRQIVSNLLSNAVKFTEVGGIETAVRVLEDGPAAQTLEIAVADTGAGMTPEQQARLFHDFAQATADTANKHGGTGLGLVICKRLALLMGGDITLESTLGRGTTARLTVPLPIGNPDELEVIEGQTGVTARTKPSREAALEERSLLLLAEDHPVNRTVLSHQLHLIGFHVDTANDGEDAFEEWLSGRYAMVLTDLNMPRLDGYDLARRIRSHEASHGLARIPIMALSANVMQGEPEKCRAAGMDDFAGKPTTIPFLASRLHKWLPYLDWTAPAVAPEVIVGAPVGGAMSEGRPPIDPATLDELTGGDAELGAALIEDFMDATVEDLAALRQSYDGREGDAVRRQGHRIKGAARIVGAHEVLREAERIETTASAEPVDWASVEVLMTALEGAFDRVRTLSGAR